MALNNQTKETEHEEEPFGLSCALELFGEVDEVFTMIDNLKNVYLHESLNEKAYERFHFIIGQYKEQPHLLDSHLDELLEKLIAIIRNEENCMDLKHFTFKYMFVIVNVRGYKVIVRHLPHEVPDFVKVLQLLEAQDPLDSETWTTRYILLLWMSIIVMIPFDLCRFDGFDDNETKQETVMVRVLNIIKTYVVVTDKCRDAAAYFSAFFISRNDVKKQFLLSYIDWAIELSLKEDSNIFVKYGTLSSIAMILKHGKREDLIPHAPKLLQWVVNTDIIINGTNIQKLVYKVIQRIGLVFLAPRLAVWRYQRGSRSLSSNLCGGDSSSLPTPQTSTKQMDEDIEVPDEIEEVIDQLIQGLTSSDGIVRWSAAKGIGRVTGRLSQDLADEVVGSVLELFNPRQSDGAWHGGCLALAELGRRGLLLPKRLPEVVPLILKALIYDEPRGYSSVGSHIRDAACYVCWSFARAYETDVLRPFVAEIAANLLVVTCFDREINCRRAASAAFQENVGRQGTFPHGIEILTVADFFAVSVRQNSYLNISVYIAQFEEYTLTLINHLIEKKIDHWDIVIRELSAKALHNLTPNSPEFMVVTVLPLLFDKVNSIDLNSRHGAVLAIGEIFYALSKINKIESMIGNDLVKKTEILVPLFRERLHFRGMGGELMKQACCEFIEKCSLALFDFQGDAIIGDWLNLLNECMSYHVLNIRTAALKALPVFLNQYYRNSEFMSKQNNLVEKYIQEVSSTVSQENRMGHALALGNLPKFILLPNLDKIINSLIESTFIRPITVKWAESRRDSIKALTVISQTLTDEIGGEKFGEDKILKIYHVLLEGLTDYTQDKRGDVGAWVREASMLGLQTLTLNVAQKFPQILNETLVTKIVRGVAQQAVEKIDRTRSLAGRVFYSFLESVPNIPNYESIVNIFTSEECDKLNWNSASDTFPKFVQLIQFPSYSYYVMLGLVCSVGGLTETLVKNASNSLFGFMKTRNLAELLQLCDIIYNIFNDYLKNDRIIVPMLRFLEKLFSSGIISIVLEDAHDFSKKTLKLVLSEVTGCKDIYKLIDGINLLAQFIQVSEVCQSVLVQLSIFLCHRQSYVRRSTSVALYESLLLYGDSININTENLDEIMQILSDTNWENPVDEIKSVRNELCTLMGIRAPVPKVKI